MKIPSTNSADKFPSHCFALGLDLSQEFPKPLTDKFIRAADVVITMGCGERCPVVPGARREDWPIEDPRGQPLKRVREIRDAIRKRVETLVAAEALARRA